MNLYINLKSLYRFQFLSRNTLEFFLVVLFSVLLSSCGNGDAELQVKKFCSQVKTGEPMMDVVARAGKVDFDKYWLEKYREEPSKGDNIGIVRPRDLEKKTEKLKKMNDPKTWLHGQFKAMIQELGYSRHICTVDFTKNKVLKREVVSVD